MFPPVHVLIVILSAPPLGILACLGAIRVVRYYGLDQPPADVRFGESREALRRMHRER